VFVVWELQRAVVFHVGSEGFGAGIGMGKERLQWCDDCGDGEFVLETVDRC